MHISAGLAPLSNILAFCDRKGWSVSLQETEDGSVLVYTPWKMWEIARNGNVTVRYEGENV